MTDFYFSYFGGKRTEFSHVEDLITFWAAGAGGGTFVEPFCGSCATSLKASKKLPGLRFHVNDIDDYHLRILREVKEKGTSSHLFEYVALKNQSITIERFKEGVEADKKKVATVEEQFYYSKIYDIRKYTWGDGRAIKDKSPKISKNYAATDQFFVDATITCSDYKDIMAQYHDDPAACLYFDPPYLDSCNVIYMGYNNLPEGEIRDNTHMYIDILEFFKTCKCGAIMIINSNAINRYLYAPWIVGSYAKKYGNQSKGKQKRTTSHLVISNIATAAQLAELSL